MVGWRERRQMLIAALPLCAAGKTKSIFHDATNASSCIRSLRSLWHFFLIFSRFFFGFLLRAAARKFFLRHFGTPWKANGQLNLLVTSSGYWQGDDLGGGRGESEVVPRPASALHHHFARPSKWNVKLNGNNFDWIFLYTGYGWQKFEGNAVASRGMHD